MLCLLQHCAWLLYFYFSNLIQKNNARKLEELGFGSLIINVLNNMTNNEWEEEKMLELRKLLEEFHINIYTDGVHIFRFARNLLAQTRQDTVKEVIGKITDVVAYKKKGPVYAEAVIEIINQLRSEYKID